MAAVIFSVGNAIRRQFDFKKEKIRETPFSFFFFFLGVSLSLTCTHYTIFLVLFFPTGNQSAEGGKVWHVLRRLKLSSSEQDSHLLVVVPLILILSRLDLILFFLNCLLIWRILRRCSPMVNNTEMVRPEQQEIFSYFPSPPLLAVRVL